MANPRGHHWTSYARGVRKERGVRLHAWLGDVIAEMEKTHN